MNVLEFIPPQRYPTVFFGSFFVSDGCKPAHFYLRHPIEWLVLQTRPREGRALLLSKYLLDWELFGDCDRLAQCVDQAWETSYLRKLLNEDLFQDWFTPEEREQILPFHPQTTDRLGLLSAAEVKQFFPEDGSGGALLPMTFDPGDGGKQNQPIEWSMEPAPWWTRTPGEEWGTMVCVGSDGKFWLCEAEGDEIGIRPAMWVRLSSTMED